MDGRQVGRAGGPVRLRGILRGSGVGVGGGFDAGRDQRLLVRGRSTVVGWRDWPGLGGDRGRSGRLRRRRRPRGPSLPSRSTIQAAVRWCSGVERGGARGCKRTRARLVGGGCGGSSRRRSSPRRGWRRCCRTRSAIRLVEIMSSGPVLPGRDDDVDLFDVVLAQDVRTGPRSRRRRSCPRRGSRRGTARWRPVALFWTADGVHQAGSVGAARGARPGRARSRRGVAHGRSTRPMRGRGCRTARPTRGARGTASSRSQCRCSPGRDDRAGRRRTATD